MASNAVTETIPKPVPETIDTDGDVVINCSGVCFLVSSKAVSLASPVFRAMFTSMFKEGLALRAPSSPGGRATIKLPSDSADAFRIFSYYAHHNLEALPNTISPDSLLELAIFIDKYGCAALMMHTCETWSKQCLKGVSEEGLWQLLQAAYVLRWESSFAQISRSLIQKRKEPFHDWAFAISNNVFFSEDFIAKLDKLRTSVARKTENALMDPICQLANTPCKGLKTMIFVYNRTLKEREILPGILRYHQKSITQIHQALGSLSSSWGRTMGTLYNEGCHGTCGDCSYHKKLVTGLQLKLLQITEGPKLCLSCVKGEGCSKHRLATKK